MNKKIKPTGSLMSGLEKKNYTLNHNKLTRHRICSATFSLLLHTLLAGMTTRNQKVPTQIYPVSSGYIYFILSVYFFKVSWTFHWPFRNSFSESNTHTHTHTHTQNKESHWAAPSITTVGEPPLLCRSWRLSSSLYTRRQVCDHQRTYRPRILRGRCPYGVSRRFLRCDVGDVDSFSS